MPQVFPSFKTCSHGLTDSTAYVAAASGEMLSGVASVAARRFDARTASPATARLFRELDSTGRKLFGVIGEGLPILTRQPWPASDQTSQLYL